MSESWSANWSKCDHEIVMGMPLTDEQWERLMEELDDVVAVVIAEFKP